MSTKPTIQSFNVLGELIVQKYERYLPTAFDESMTLLEKINKVIEYINQLGILVNDVVKQWNEVMEWVMNEGLEESVNIKLEKWLIDGTLDDIINHKIFDDLNNKIDNLEKEMYEFETEIRALFEKLKKEIEEELKSFSILKNSPSYLYDLQLEEQTVNQSLAVDEQNGYAFATQVTYRSDPEGFSITRMGLGGEKIDSMKVIGGGHGTTMFAEPSENGTFLWLTIVERDASGEQIGNHLCRFLYRAGTEITPNSAGVQKYTNYPNPKIYMSPFGDYKNDYIAFRHTDNTNGTRTHIEIHKLSDVKNNIYQPIYDYVFPSFLNSQIMQGFALDETDLYLGMGQTADDFNIYRIDVKTGTIIEQISKVKIQNPANTFDDNFGEPEGMFLYTDPNTKLKTLLFVVVMNRAGARRQKLFGLSNNMGIYKFLGYQGERSQNIKLTYDDGRAKRITITKLSDIPEFGWWYFTSAEMDKMEDHPNKELGGGWWIFNGARDTQNARIQHAVRNSSATPHKYERVVATDNTSSIWRRLLGEHIFIYKGDTSGDFSSTFELSETIDNFDLIYIRLNSPTGLMGVTKVLDTRDIVSNDILFNFINVPDSSGTNYSVYEFAITLNENRDGFVQKRATELAIGSTVTRNNNVSNIGVAVIIGVRL